MAASQAGVAVADVDGGLALGPRHPGEVGDDRLGHLDQLALVDVGRRAVHGRAAPGRG